MKMETEQQPINNILFLRRSDDKVQYVTSCKPQFYAQLFYSLAQ